MGKAVFIYSEDTLKYDFGPSHVFRPFKEKRTYELLLELNVLGTIIDLIPPNMAERSIIELVHSKEYVDFIIKMSRIGYGLLDYGDTPAFPGVYEASAYRVGASALGAKLLAQGKYDVAFNPGGGLHHARKDMAAGFCVFNDIAVAVRYLQRYHNMSRIAVFDMDVHHGDGTQEEFYNERVLTISTHMYTRGFYPGTGWIDEVGEGEGYGYCVNIPLPPGTGDDAYLYAFEQIVEPILERYKPEIIVLQYGGDSLKDDLLGMLKLTTYCYVEVAKRLKRIASKFNGKLLMLGGGGYNYEHTARAWALGFLEAAGVHVDSMDKLHDEQSTTTDSSTYKIVKDRVGMLKEIFNL